VLLGGCCHVQRVDGDYADQPSHKDFAAQVPAVAKEVGLHARVYPKDGPLYGIISTEPLPKYRYVGPRLMQGALVSLCMLTPLRILFQDINLRAEATCCMITHPGCAASALTNSCWDPEHFSGMTSHVACLTFFSPLLSS
jgi:hypothetical protein